MRSRARALALLLPVALACGCRGRSPAPKPKGRSGPVHRPIPDPVRDALFSVDPRTIPDVMARENTLEPDARFVSALREVSRLLRGIETPEPRVQFAEGRWAVEIGGVPAGTLSEIPSYQEAAALCRSWATEELKRHPLQEGAGGAAARGVPVGLDPVSDGPLRALQNAERAWRDGGRRAEHLDAAARALPLLVVGTLDGLGIADVLQARALALLSLRQVALGSPLSSEEVLMAWEMGYGEEAKAMAKALAPEAPVRMYVERNHDALRRLAESPRADALSRYLFLDLESSRWKYDEWVDWLRRFPLREPPHLPLLKTMPRDFGMETPIAAVTVRAVEAELGTREEAGAFWTSVASQLRTTGRIGVPEAGKGWPPDLEQLEKKLAPSRGDTASLFGKELQAVYLRALYYSAVNESGTFLLSRLASGPAAVEYGAAIKGTTGLPSEFARWFRDLAAFKNGDLSAKERLVDDLKTTPSLGHPAVREIGDLLRSRLEATDRIFGRAAAGYMSRLDTRVLDRYGYASWLLATFHDMERFERFYESCVRADPDAQLSTPWAMRYRGDYEGLKELARDRSKPAAARLDALRYLDEAGRISDEELRRGLTLIPADPENAWGFMGAVRMLYEKKHFSDAECVLRERLDHHPEDTALAKALWASRLERVYFVQGRYEDAWNAISPWVGTGKGDALSAAAEALEGLGKHEEALAMARQETERYPADTSSYADLAGVLWRQGQFTEAPRTLVGARPPIPPSDWDKIIAKRFYAIFRDAPGERIGSAFQPIVDSAVNPWYQIMFPAWFAKAGRFDVAAQMMEQVWKRMHLIDPYLDWVRWIGRAKGAEAARTWVKTYVTAAKYSWFVQTALDQRLFELVWIDMPQEISPDAREQGWLVRTEAFALDPKRTREQEAALREHYRSADPSSLRTLLGRFLLGESNEEEVYRRMVDSASRSNASYVLAIKALGTGDYRLSARWMRAVLKMGGEHGEDAKNALLRWTRTEKSLDVLKQEGYL